MKRKWIAAMSAALLTVSLPLTAMGELIFNGEVTAGETLVIAAPFGGVVSNMSVREGESVKVGQTIATMKTTKVYSMMEGVVTGVFAQAGDEAASIKERYGALIYIEPNNRYTLACSTEKAHNASENHYIHIGETVYLTCTKDGTHKGRGVVTALDDSDETKYTVEVTGGEFYMGETVAIHRDEQYTDESRIGRGTVSRTKPIAVNAEGSVLKMHVEAGDAVERGEVLMETVNGTLDGLYAPSTKVLSSAKGVIATVDAKNGASVEKGGTIATLYPQSGMQVSMVISESDLMDVKVGGKTIIEFNWDASSTKRFEGTVASISYINEEKSEGSSGAQYMAYIDFTPDETVRLGMTVVVYVQ